MFCCRGKPHLVEELFQEVVVSHRQLSLQSLELSGLSHSNSAKPRLDQLIQLKGAGKTIHLIGHVSGHLDGLTKALRLSPYLISTLTEQSSTPFDATLNVMVQWLGGEGRKPVTWRTLLEALKEAHLHSLASDLEEVLGEEEDA